MAKASSSPSSSSSTSKDSMSGKTLKRFGKLIRFLPTGTVFAFQFLNPLLTNNGHCGTVNRNLASFLIGLCGLSCGFSCFTDSYKGSDGKIHYGIATLKGLWPSSDSGSVDLSNYKLRFGDFVHAFLSMILFAVVSLLDPNTVKCFYPSFEFTQKVLLMVLPPVMGAFAGSVSLAFPNNRHGIGYPSSSRNSLDNKS